tara:strand:+ start:289 stop:1278 length:990 start_codon:yes stop_codon:yes gene_type:complete
MGNSSSIFDSQIVDRICKTYPSVELLVDFYNDSSDILDLGLPSLTTSNSIYDFDLKSSAKSSVPPNEPVFEERGYVINNKSLENLSVDVISWFKDQEQYKQAFELFYNSRSSGRMKQKYVFLSHQSMLLALYLRELKSPEGIKISDPNYLGDIISSASQLRNCIEGLGENPNFWLISNDDLNINYFSLELLGSYLSHLIPNLELSKSAEQYFCGVQLSKFTARNRFILRTWNMYSDVMNEEDLNEFLIYLLEPIMRKECFEVRSLPRNKVQEAINNVKRNKNDLSKSKIINLENNKAKINQSYSWLRDAVFKSSPSSGYDEDWEYEDKK